MFALLKAACKAPKRLIAGLAAAAAVAACAPVNMAGG